MAEFVTPAIPAGQLVTITPAVLPAGGNALDLIGIIETNSWRVPIGSVYQFGDATSVGTFFGLNSQEAGLASVYFNGFDNSNVKPGLLNFWQYASSAVNAYVKGGNISALTIAQLQAFSGTLSVTIDAVLKTASINLATLTSQTQMAQYIQTQLGITGPSAASVTGSMGATFTGTGSGTNLTVSGVTGVIHPGTATSAAITGTGVPSSTYIVSQTSGTPGGAGVYVTNNATTSSGASITATSTVLDVTAVGSGTVSVGDLVSGSGLTADTYFIVAALTGTGGTGTYVLSQQTQIVSETLTLTQPAVLYDSVSGAFIIVSGTTGSSSSITYGSGALATDLLLTQATGAVLSQGAAAYTPAASQNAITAVTQDWIGFMTTFEPSDNDKIAFAQWTTGLNGGTANRYVYECWETSASDVTQGSGSALVQYLQSSNASGTCVVYENPNITTLAGEKAAFSMGCTASIDFTETNGDITFAGKHQAGLLPDITSGASAILLAGNPQVQGSYGFGVNFYGDYTTANQAFIQWQRGLISGPFRWKDDYVNQVWLDNQMQLALMVLMTTVKSLPYAQPGYAQVEAALLDPISQALNFGMIVPGVQLSNSQIAQINSGAGNANAAQAVAQQGYYLQVKPAIAQVRAGRTSPPCTLWYAVGESIQSINLASVQVQ